jgi:hypothetical protein
MADFWDHPVILVMPFVVVVSAAIAWDIFHVVQEPTAIQSQYRGLKTEQPVASSASEPESRPRSLNRGRVVRRTMDCDHQLSVTRPHDIETGSMLTTGEIGAWLSGVHSETADSPVYHSKCLAAPRDTPPRDASPCTWEDGSVTCIELPNGTNLSESSLRGQLGEAGLYQEENDPRAVPEIGTKGNSRQRAHHRERRSTSDREMARQGDWERGAGR